MKVILLDTVDGVGKKGETKEVRDGYGRNFLVPRGLAMPATQGNINKIQLMAKTLIDKREKNIKNAEQLKQRLEETPLTIRKKAGVDGKLFGSVTTKEVVDAVKKGLDLDLDKRAIHLDEQIKMTGVYTVEVHLEKGVSAQLKVEVEEEQ